MIRACEIGCDAGLRYVYAGNLPGESGDGKILTARAVMNYLSRGTAI